MPFRFPFLCRCWSFQSRCSTGCQHQPTNQQTNKQTTKQQTNNNKQHQSPVLFKKTKTHTRILIYIIYICMAYYQTNKKQQKVFQTATPGTQKKTSPESHHNQKSQSHQQIVSKIRRWKSKVCSDAMLDLKVPSNVKTLPWDTWKSRVRGRSDVKFMVFDGLSDGQMSSVAMLFCVFFCGFGFFNRFFGLNFGGWTKIKRRDTEITWRWLFQAHGHFLSLCLELRAFFPTSSKSVKSEPLRKRGIHSTCKWNRLSSLSC